MPQHASAETLASLGMPDVPVLEGHRAAFLGCGDSLAAARPAETLGHRVLSAGDVACGGAPRGVDIVVPLSWSGQTGATIRAARVAKEAGLAVVAVTANPDSPLAQLADDVVCVPQFHLAEEVPAVGYAVHSAAVAALCTGEALPLGQVAADWAAATKQVTEVVAASGPRPHGITVAAMPDAHGAGEFWMLKLIEATGLVVRTTGVEEIGHVDYFIGPQQHLTHVLSGEADSPRSTTLGDALAVNGQHVNQVRLATLTALEGWARQVVGGVVGADVSASLAHEWNRPPFRGGQVDMSARHIQVPVEPHRSSSSRTARETTTSGPA